MTSQLEMNPLLGEESPVIEFPSGLIGLEEWKHFVLVTHPEGGPLHLLQSLDDERITLIVADPRQIVSDYQVGLSEADAQALQYADVNTLHTAWPDEMDLYCILSVQENPFSVTANLLGPLIINWQARLGRQVILSDSSYDARYLVPVPSSAPATKRAAPAEGKEEE